MATAGGTVVLLPGGEIFQALQTGAIDAAEWVGPYDDEKMGFHKAAKFYYYPGWWEPGPSLEVQINLDEWNNLPEEYQAIVQAAAFAANGTARGDAFRVNELTTVDQMFPSVGIDGEGRFVVAWYTDNRWWWEPLKGAAA